MVNSPAEGPSVGKPVGVDVGIIVATGASGATDGAARGHQEPSRNVQKQDNEILHARRLEGRENIGTTTEC